MDTTSQNYGMFKAYGLVYKLLQSNVPVYWLIGNPKRRTCSTGSTSRATHDDHYTGVALGSPYSYTRRALRHRQRERRGRRTRSSMRGAPPTANQPAIHETTAAVHRRTSRSSCAARRGSRSSRSMRASPSPTSTRRASPTARQRLDRALAERPERRPHRLQQRLGLDLPVVVVGDGALFQAGACTARKYDVFVTPHNSGYAYSIIDPTERRHAGVRRARLFRRPGWRLDRAVPLDPEQRERDRRSLQLRPRAVRALFPSPTAGGFLTRFGFTTISNVGGTWTVDPPRICRSRRPCPRRSRTALPGGSVQTWPSPRRLRARIRCAHVLGRRPSRWPTS